jgi:hypothetical protein
MSDDIELAFRPVVFTGETEQFEEKCTETTVGRVTLDVLGQLGDRR